MARRGGGSGSVAFGQDAGVVAASRGLFFCFLDLQRIYISRRFPWWTRQSEANEEKAGPFSLGATSSKEDGKWAGFGLSWVLFLLFIWERGRGLSYVTPVVLALYLFSSRYYHFTPILSCMADQRLLRILHGILGQKRTSIALQQPTYFRGVFFLFFFSSFLSLHIGFMYK
ncbi:hypothetical protein LZ32DRAFT_321667 [Colletotrichum eremochloae]|nr:hypothetical protein LZ32DRAFT_321667 [Colletotrichum eremochloae]